MCSTYGDNETDVDRVVLEVGTVDRGGGGKNPAQRKARMIFL